jgi:hypothetical protein
MVFVGTEVSEDSISSIFRVRRIGKIGKLAVSSKRSKLLRSSLYSCMYYIAFLVNGLRSLVIADFVPSSPVLVTLIIEVIHSSETSYLRRATLRSILADGLLHFISDFPAVGKVHVIRMTVWYDTNSVAIIP